MREKARRAHVDANVILRLLLGEPENQALSSKAIFDRASRAELTAVIHPVVCAEVIYVLTSPRLAAYPRRQVADVLRGFFALEGVEVVDLDVVLKALRQFEETNLDWVDCLLLAYSPEIPVYTFDQAMVTAGGVHPNHAD
jgi:predicted nucleic acid-binding protein